MPPHKCAHGVCNVRKRFVPIHIAYAMCIEAPPYCTRNRARARFYWLAYVPGIGGWRGAPGITTTRVHFKLHLHVRVITTLVGMILGIAFLVLTMLPSQPFPFVQPNLYRDVRSGILDFTTSFASPSRVWCQYLFAFSKATRARELKSSGAKAAECSCSCSTEETGEAYTCGGIPGVLFTVTQLTPQLCTRGSYNIHTVFSVVVYTFLPGNASQDLFHKPCWNVHGTSFSIFRPEISGNLS